MMRVLEVASGTSLLENSLDIPEVIHQIRKNDDIKLFIQAQLMCISLDETEIRMALPGTHNHFVREIHPDPDARLKGRQQIAMGAPDLKDPLPRPDQELIDLHQPSVIIPSPPGPRIQAAGKCIPVRLTCLSVVLAGSLCPATSDCFHKMCLQWMGPQPTTEVPLYVIFPLTSGENCSFLQPE